MALLNQKTYLQHKCDTGSKNISYIHSHISNRLKNNVQKRNIKTSSYFIQQQSVKNSKIITC